MKNHVLPAFLFCLFFLTAGYGAFAQQDKSQWRNLFNGKDLRDWDTYLRATNLSGYSEDSTVPYQPPIGLNNDPLHVFTVHDGMIHISGEIWGAITTKESFGNYHLRFEMKWGEKKYAPKDKSLRDGGLLFHCTEGFDYAFKCWMRSMEMQVQETEIGDFFNVGGGDAEFQVKERVATGNHEIADQYDPNQPLVRHPGRVYRSGNFESPHGEWTTCEMIARGADAVFIVNGFVVNRMFNIYRKDLQQQVVKGKLQFQSEGAEHFYRTIQIRPISFKQSDPKLVASTKELIVSSDKKNQIEITNKGGEVEIIAAELMGKNIEQFKVDLPTMPMILKKNQKIILPVSVRDGNNTPNRVIFRLETVLGPVEDFQVALVSQ